MPMYDGPVIRAGRSLFKIQQIMDGIAGSHLQKTNLYLWLRSPAPYLYSKGARGTVLVILGPTAITPQKRLQFHSQEGGGGICWGPPTSANLLILWGSTLQLLYPLLLPRAPILQGNGPADPQNTVPCPLPAWKGDLAKQSTNRDSIPVSLPIIGSAPVYMSLGIYSIAWHGAWCPPVGLAQVVPIHACHWPWLWRAAWSLGLMQGGWGRQVQSPGPDTSSSAPAHWSVPGCPVRPSLQKWGTY